MACRRRGGWQGREGVEVNFIISYYKRPWRERVAWSGVAWCGEEVTGGEEVLAVGGYNVMVNLCHLFLLRQVERDRVSRGSFIRIKGVALHGIVSRCGIALCGVVWCGGYTASYPCYPTPATALHLVLGILIKKTREYIFQR